ncbi:hypothetical protein KKC60_03245 [Patescibacteria group bacterium]|nr:hypothetical protein [Patescibacteria group bacterium]
MNRKIIFVLVLAFMLTNASLCTQDKTPENLGVFLSTDYGEKYEQANKLPDDKNLNKVSVMDISIDAFNPSLIYLCTRDQGIFKSVNSGELWERTSIEAGTFYHVAIDPKNNRTLYAAGFVDNYGKLLKSTDGGKEWEEVYRETHEESKVFNVQIDSFDTRKIYAVTEKGAVIKSEDNGRSWVVKHWFPKRVVLLKISPFDSRHIYVGSPDFGMAKSLDGGETWEEIIMYQNKEEIVEVAVEEENEQGETITVTKEDKVYKLLDEIYENSDHVFDFEFHPQDQNTIYVSSEFGLLRTTDGGTIWQPVNLLVPPGENSLVRFVIDPQNPNNIYLSLDNSIYKTRDAGAHWTVKKITDSFIHALSIDPEDSGRVYVGAWYRGEQ